MIRFPMVSRSVVTARRRIAAFDPDHDPEKTERSSVEAADDDGVPVEATDEKTLAA